MVALEVVTGDGVVRTCGPGDELFAAALGGLGQCGIITRATPRLVTAPPRITRHEVDYDTVAAAAADQVRFVEEGRFDFVQGQVRFGEAGRRVFLETAAYSGGDLFYLEFQHRLDAAEALLTGTGAWFHPHPWWNCFLPASAAVGFLTALVERLTPADLGPAGCVLFYPVFTGEVHAPLVRLPAERIDFLVAILRFPPDDAGLVARQVAENRRLYEEARAGRVHLPGRRDPLHAGGLAPPLRLAVAFAVRVEVALRPGRGADPRAGDLLAPGQFSASRARPPRIMRP
ncbi:Orf32 [Amycolatopsis methanolica 239]|uniref:Orf32 n=1 Tax=Amycolatopsis methanolica 239 TaxID=1068978 RepID=A0A076MMK8_AMYME|nr:Orf32 [Amycolatopsis methanolica 239]